jgi:hypothetical protein
MAIKTRLAKLEKVERERLSAEVGEAEAAIIALAGTFFTATQLQILDLVCMAGDLEVRELSWEERQKLYTSRRWQTPLEDLRQMLAAHQWLITKLQELVEAKHETK